MSRYSRVVKRKKKSRLLSFLPETAQAFIARRIIDATGAILILGGAAFLTALFSYDAADPSWNTARDLNGSGIHNWMGLPGAYIADIFVQTLGMGGGLMGLIIVLWGASVLRRRKISPFLPRLTAALAAMILGAVALARVPSGQWSLHPWLGGSGGTIILDRTAAFIGRFTGGHAHTVTATVAAVLTFIILLYALAVSRADVITFVKFTFSLLRQAVQNVASGIAGFADWVKHYGDPGYQPVRKVRRPRIAREKPKRERKVPTLAQPALETLGPAAPDKKSIQVVGQEKTAMLAAPSRQKSFMLESDGDWELPGVDLLQEVRHKEDAAPLDEESLRKNAEMLQAVLKDFHVDGEIVSIHPGPVVTLYELEPAPGVKSSRVIGLSDDIARSMSAVSVRCAVIPGRNVIGIELPNSVRQTVYMRELLESPEIPKARADLPLILGKDIGGHPVIADLSRMPHLLVAGTTGSGKSVAVNTMILSLLYHLPPEKCRFIMIDPKMLELSIYDDIPHLLSPVVTEPGKAVVALKWAVQEMEDRYRAMSKLGVRNIEGYNQRLRQAVKKGETLMRKVQTGFDPDTGKPVYEEQPLDMTELPFIVIIVDEFADLMLVAGKDVENAVQRLAQMARAAGIHLIMATQRPSVDVITGVIKANFPTRISFQVTSKVDSRTILNEGGAEQLLGMGDMLYMASGGRIRRVHGPFVSDEDVENVVTFLKRQGEPAYISDVTEGGFTGDSEIMGALFGGEGGGGDSGDDLYDQAVAIVAQERKASTSYIQRRLQIGYNRAARIIEEMEKQGVVGPANHVGKREVLVGSYTDA
jgi:DNA segregation ATPase FtsK/SpoIIIE, S-DNA-T family